MSMSNANATSVSNLTSAHKIQRHCSVNIPKATSVPHNNSTSTTMATRQCNTGFITEVFLFTNLLLNLKNLLTTKNDLTHTYFFMQATGLELTSPRVVNC